MKISKITGYVWPIEINCDTCGVTFEVDHPADMLRHTEYSYPVIDGVTVPTVKRRYVTTSCPCCKAVHEILDTKVPPVLTKAIPMASGVAPMCD